jgi:hypothetical protein
MFKLAEIWELNILIHERTLVRKLKCSFPILEQFLDCKYLCLQCEFMSL